MPNIYTGISGQKPPPGDVTAVLQPFTGEYLLALRQAFLIIERGVVGSKSCNDAFSSLPYGRTFSDVWQDPSIWVYYWEGTGFIDDKEPYPAFGWSNFVRGVIFLSRNTMQGCRSGHLIKKSYNTAVFVPDKMIGPRAIAATLVHELAHHAGAEVDTSQAEDTLKRCSFADIDFPGKVG